MGMMGLPIAYAVTKGETRDSWNWFLENLISAIGPVRDHCWCFITNQQKMRNFLFFSCFPFSIYLFIKYWM